MGKWTDDSQDGSDWVDVKVLQKAFKDSKLSASEVARRLDWVTADASRFRRTIGLTTTRHGGKRRGKDPYMAKRTRVKQAMKIIEALDVDPCDYNL